MTKPLEKKSSPPQAGTSQNPETQFSEAFARLVTAMETIAGCAEMLCVKEGLLDKDKALYDLNAEQDDGDGAEG